MLGAESLSLSFGKTHPSYLILRRKLQELGRKAGLGLGRSQHCGQHADRQRLAWPCNLYFLKCQGCLEAGVRLFLQHSLVPVYPCMCQCEIRRFPAFPSVTSIGSLCPWVVFAFPHQERRRDAPARLGLLTDFPHCALAICSYAKNKSCFCWCGPWLVVIGSFLPCVKGEDSQTKKLQPV